MRISLSPQRRDDTLAVSKAGDVLTINGAVVDLSTLPEGAALPAEAIENEFVVGEVTRIDGELQIALILPHGPDPSAAVAFPEPIIDPPDGALELPQ